MHGSPQFPFPDDKAPTRRVTLIFSFHQRASAVGVTARNGHASMNGSHRQTRPFEGGLREEGYDFYTRDYVSRRARVIPLAVNARRQRYPDEPAPFVYRGEWIGDSACTEAARAELATEGAEYWLRNVSL